MKPQSIDEVFRGQFPDKYLEKALRGLFGARRTAYEASKQYQGPEAYNWEWFDRRAKVETMAHEIASEFDGMTAMPSRGEPGTHSNWYHRRVQSGRAILTFHSGSHPDEPIEPSEARRQYSATCARQLSLFEDDGQDSLAPDDWIVYAQLQHGGSGKRGELGFAVVRFPLAGGTGYHDARIDLFKMFPGVVADMQRHLGAGQAGEDEPDIHFHEGEEQV